MLDDLDKAIDDVAHDMTAVPVDPTLPARISARLRVETAGQHSGWWHQPRLLVPLTAACVLVLAIFIVRERFTNARRRNESRAVPTAAAPSVGRAPIAVTTARNDEHAGDENPRTPRSTRVRTVARPRLEIAPLLVRPIDIEPIPVAPLARSQQIDIDPIVIGRIEITAMP